MMTEVPKNTSTTENTLKAKAAFKKLGKSVCILSCFNNGQRHASVATAVCNVSNTPPSLLICLEKSASLIPHLTQSNSFAVNVLGADQQDIVTHCMNTNGEDRFAIEDWVLNDNDWQPANKQLPILSRSQAIFYCQVAEVGSFETHHILVARIEDSYCSDDTNGLIYLGGRFHRLGEPKKR